MARALIAVQIALLAISIAGAAPCGVGSPARGAAARFAAEHGIPAAFVERGGARFVLVEPGTFPWRAPSGDVHTVAMRLPFYIQAQPMEAGATWHRAQRLAEQMTRANRDHRYRLPTEAEWMWAHARHPFPANGIEGSWCADWLGPHPEQDLSNPVGPRTGTERVALTPTQRLGRRPSVSDARIGVRLVAQLGWRGDREVHVRTVVRDRSGAIVGEASGLRLHVIRILDRLADRQAGREEAWTDLPGTTPLTLRMFPGRYYLRAFVEASDGTRRFGPEQKILVASGGHRVAIDAPEGR